MKICVSSWSLCQHICRGLPLPVFAKEMFQRYRVKGVELSQMTFRRALPGWESVGCVMAYDSVFLDDIVAGTKEVGAKIVNIPIDLGNITGKDEKKRAYDLNVLKGWIDVAAYVESAYVRFNTGACLPSKPIPLDPERDIPLAIDSYRKLMDYAEQTSVGILLENHGGITADPDAIVEIAEALKGRNFGVIADFGNFPDDIRYEALEKIVPYTKLIHAKTYQFNDAGEEGKYDFGRCLNLFKEQGYDGWISAEFEGTEDQYTAVGKTISLIEKELAR